MRKRFIKILNRHLSDLVDQEIFLFDSIILFYLWIERFVVFWWSFSKQVYSLNWVNNKQKTMYWGSSSGLLLIIFDIKMIINISVQTPKASLISARQTCTFTQFYIFYYWLLLLHWLYFFFLQIYSLIISSWKKFHKQIFKM